MALVTAKPPPPLAALAPLLRGLLSMNKLSLGSGTTKSQRSRCCLPPALPPHRPPALWDGKKSTENTNLGVGAPRSTKEKTLRDGNGAFLMVKHRQYPKSQPGT